MFTPFAITILGLVGLPSLVLCAPLSLSTMHNYEVIEFCIYDKAIWQNDPQHICQYLRHPEKNINELIPDLKKISRILEIRPIYKNYWGRKDMDGPILRKCYLRTGVFAQCLGEVQTRLEIIGFTEASKARLQTMWEQYLKDDENLVGHCFWFHHDDDYPPCRGISYDRNLGNPSARNQHLLNRWAMEQEALEAHIAEHKSKNASILAQIDLCLYQNDWRYKEAPSEEETRCFYVTGLRNVSDSTSSTEKARIEAMKAAYDEQKLWDKVADCYLHHRKDYNEYSGCRNISWSLEARNGLGGFYMPEDPTLARMWYKVAEYNGEENIWRKVSLESAQLAEQSTGFLGDLQAIMRNETISESDKSSS